MKNEWLTNPQDVQIQGLLDRYVRSRFPVEDLSASGEHLDYDSLTAFVEGNISEREAKPMTRHLVECSFCRHITAELIKLEMDFAENEMPNTVTQDQPSRISEVMNGLLSRLFGANDGVVFAHQEKEEGEEKADRNNDSEN